MRVAVIGAGPAGLTAAHQLVKRGIDTTVYEASPGVGGLARSLNLWGHRVDVGPHRFFSSSRRVNEFWLDIVGRDYVMVDRVTRIHYDGRFFNYPLQLSNVLVGLGPFTSAACALSYANQTLARTRDDGSFESWVVQRFGRKLFELLFKSYSEKLWGIPCHELDADFAAQRIKKLTFYEAVKSALINGAGNKHKTLVDRFAYPIGGTGMVYERLAERIQSGGGRVYLRCPVRRVVTQNDTVTALELEDGTVEPFDAVISSMPLTQLVQRLPDVPADLRDAAGSLRFRNTILVYLHVDSRSLFGDQWLYIHSPQLRVGRITNFRNWTEHLHKNEPGTVLSLEYWCYDADPIWTDSDDAIKGVAFDEIRQTGLVGEAALLDAHVLRIKRCYPVYDKGYRDRLGMVEAYLSGIRGLEAIGRYGAFKYNNQDHSILMGLLAAENVAEGAQHNLWGVNTDYETYQESAIITDAGLVGR